MLESIPDGVEDDGIGDNLVPVVHGELGGKGDRLIDGPLFDDFAQILRFGRGKFPHPHFVKNNQIELGEFCAIPKVGPARGAAAATRKANYREWIDATLGNWPDNAVAKAWIRGRWGYRTVGKRIALYAQAAAERAAC